MSLRSHCSAQLPSLDRLFAVNAEGFRGFVAWLATPQMQFRALGAVDCRLACVGDVSPHEGDERNALGRGACTRERNELCEVRVPPCEPFCISSGVHTEHRIGVLIVRREPFAAPQSTLT